MLVTVVTAALFYASWIGAVVLIPFGILYYRKKKTEWVEKRRRDFRKQFQNALESLSAALNIGYSMENAVKETQKDMQLMYAAKTPIVREFTYMARQLNLNVAAERAWKEFADRVDIPEVQSFASVFALAKRNGGDSIAVIRSAIRQIGDKADVEREIATIISSKKLEFHVMSVIPFGIIGYMRLAFPEFMGALYGNIPGAAFMSACLLLYLGAWKLGSTIIKIEV